MKTLGELRARCECRDGHWIWGGGTCNGTPRIWAPDHTNGGMAGQNGARAAWHMKHRKPIPAGSEVFATCGESMCLNPAHLEVMTRAEFGERVRQTGKHKGLLSKTIANRKINRARSKLTPELFEEILSSPKTGQQLVAETGICRTTISRVRTGKATAFQSVGGAFGGGLLVAQMVAPRG